MNNNTQNTLNVLKRGHLYFHTKLGRVERAIFQENGNVVHRHHGETNVSGILSFRLASQDEVKAYLKR